MLSLKRLAIFCEKSNILTIISKSLQEIEEDIEKMKKELKKVTKRTIVTAELIFEK